MNSGNGLALAGLITAIIGAVLPLVGLYVGWVALVFATFGALAGSRGMAIAVVAVSAVVFLFLTPSLWIEAAAFGTGYGEATGSSPFLRIVSLGLLAAPIVGIFLGKPSTGQS